MPSRDGGVQRLGFHELRAIGVTTRAALRHAMTVEDLERVKDTSTELLARLEERVIRDGGEPDVLAAI